MMIFVLFGIAGLAIDAGQMYATKQRAQAAADAGAEAGVMDLYRGTGNSTAAAAAYVQQNGFTSAETAIDYPDCTTLAWCNGHVRLSGTDTPNLIRVTVTRTVPTTFMRALGVTASTISAVGVGAISLEPQPVPILVLHPTLSGAFSKNGGNTIEICGGPVRAIQVNSTSTTSVVISGTSGRVDLSHAGPLDNGTCSTGTGADFANVALQSQGAAFPSGYLLLGSKPGHYVYPASVIKDPLLSVAEPSVQPAAAAAPVTYTLAADLATHNCPLTCTVYSPGYYDGTTRRLDNIAGYAILRPGIYWINHKGFQLGSNTIIRMASAAVDQTDPSTGTGWTNQVLIYNKPQSPVTSNDMFSISSNSGKLSGNQTYPSTDCPNGGNCFKGSPSAGAYKGILFFQSRGTATTLNHSMSGGSGLTVEGTVYLTHTAASIAIDGTYQSFSLQGGSGGTTKVQGEIITDAISLGGTSGITMNLISTATFLVRQVALVQ
jgi:hypothetical protein